MPLRLCLSLSRAVTLLSSGIDSGGKQTWYQEDTVQLLKLRIQSLILANSPFYVLFIYLFYLVYKGACTVCVPSCVPLNTVGNSPAAIYQKKSEFPCIQRQTSRSVVSSLEETRPHQMSGTSTNHNKHKHKHSLSPLLSVLSEVQQKKPKQVFVIRVAPSYKVFHGKG